jgi:hypothetical protein
MDMQSKSIFLLSSLFLLLVIPPIQTTVPPDPSPTSPIYDPLVEPPLPENPTEYELGQNLYWHWCMTCHGDRGQGLTDEFRAIWEPEHQDCWGRGCHAGRSGDGGFPIPTVVPALVNESHLSKFDSVQDLSDFLRETHPPQSPGILKNEDYHAIALFVFTMNERSLVDAPVLVPSPSVTEPAIPSQEPIAESLPLYGILFAMILVSIFVLTRSMHLQK